MSQVTVALEGRRGLLGAGTEMRDETVSAAEPKVDEALAVAHGLKPEEYARLVKLIGNAISAVSMETLGEVFALARKCGLDSQQLLTVLTGTMYGGRFHTIYGGKIAGEQYGSGGFLFPLILKDVRLALSEAESAGVPTPSLSVVRDRLIAGIARGYSDRDWSALGLLASEEAGLSVEHQNHR